MRNQMICVDVWGGEYSEKHVARYMLPKSEALALSSQEIDDGFLVNLRAKKAWGPESNFDDRIKLND